MKTGRSLDLNNMIHTDTIYYKISVIYNYHRFLQGPETDPATVRKIRNAIDNQTEVTVQLINYTKSGMFVIAALFSYYIVLQNQRRFVIFIEHNVLLFIYIELIIFLSYRIQARSSGTCFICSLCVTKRCSLKFRREIYVLPCKPKQSDSSYL